MIAAVTMRAGVLLNASEQTSPDLAASRIRTVINGP